MACRQVSWEELIAGIREAFSTDRVDVDAVKLLMDSYKSDKSDWERFANFDPHKYTRNLVDCGNDKYNLLLLCWNLGHGSSIHDHADSHCFMKMLTGCLKETQYSWPCASEGAMESIGSNTYYCDEVTYINDSIGLHRVENPDHSEVAVSLHLYCPPIRICQSFDERTGKPHRCHVTFFSKNGVPVAEPQ